MLEKIKKFINDYIKPFAGKAAEWIGAHKKGFIAIVVAAVILIAGLIAFLCTRSAQPDFPIFYQKDDKIYVRTPNSNSSSLVSKGYAKEVERYTKLSDDGKRLFYADNFTQENNTSRYNLHVYNGDSTWLNGDRNVTVGKNVTGDYRLKSDSSAVYYMAHDDGAVNLYRYNCESGKSERLAENVADFKLLDKSNQVYYLTSDGLLYRCSEGGDVYIDEAADSFYAYENPDGTQTELYYLKKTKQNGVFDLYLIKDNDKKSDIAAKSITGARFSEYTCGGSLYYFKPSTVKLNWKNWIDDDLAQKDSAMKKPSQFDYWKTENWLGFIPHKVLDEEKYNAALAEYNKKIQRDALRQTLSGVGGEASLSAAYDCYVYRGGVSHLLAQKVATSGILASFKNGEAIVYEKSQFSSPKKIKLSELDVAKVMADPAAFFGELAGNLTSGRNGELEFAMWSEGKLRKSDLGVLSVASEAVFSEDGSTLYIREPIEQSGDLYCYYIDEAGLNRQKTIDISVTRMSLTSAGLFYIKGISHTDATLYRYVTDKPEFVESNVSGFSVTPDGNILLYMQASELPDKTITSTLKLRYGKESGELAGQVKQAAENVAPYSALYYNDSSILFTEKTENGASALKWYHGKNKSTKIDTNVVKVFR